MVRRNRLSRGRLVVMKPRGRLKFDSYHALESHMRDIGAAGTLNDVVTMEVHASRDAGFSHGRKEIQDRVLMWWNQKSEKPDVLSQRPSYVMTYMLREAAKKRLK